MYPFPKMIEWLKKMFGKFGLIFALLFIFALFAVIAPESFSSRRSIETMTRQMAITGVAALGMTLIIILGGIDLSIGSVVALTTVIIAIVLRGFTGDGHSAEMYDIQVGSGAVVIALIFGGGAAAIVGFLNGVLITRLRVVPFIVTLGMLLIVRGVAKGLAHEQKVDAPTSLLNSLLAPNDGFMSHGVIVMLVLAILVSILLTYTRLGRQIYAIGSNELTARLCGVMVERTKLIVYTLASFSVGIAGTLQFSRLTVGDPTVAGGLELDVIAAVVIGGGSLSGGEGSVLGTMVGVAIITVIRTGCSHMGLPNWVQEIITGCIIVSAVAIDRIRHRRAA